MLKFEKVTKDNYDKVLEIKHFLFPESKSDEDYEKYFAGLQKAEYYLVYFNNEPCAITGWYDFDDKNIDAFMGWFGVLPQFRKMGIGMQVLDFTINQVKCNNYNAFRTYTDKVVNADSVRLYEKAGLIIEDYTYPDKLGETGNFVVFTKMLKSEKIELWDNRPLNEDDNYDF